ncbi:hypothetical protein [Mesorhizobium sp.]|uniref:hypothetical protein n=1 Tax=Mesorhizobium sp. TaxID=1871066 RepID=UPI002579BB67|nr:hypothetical protein [Mesorhizobium sp.]
MTEDQIKTMVDRFLTWRLPEDFNPDGGISFDSVSGWLGPHPSKREPVGTNLLTAVQATAMVRNMVEGLLLGVSEKAAPAVARAHIRIGDGAPYPDVDLEVLDGAFFQPEMSPVLLYAAPDKSMTGALNRGIALVEAFLRYFNPNDMPEDQSQQWQQLERWVKTVAVGAPAMEADAVKGLADQVLDFFKAARDEGLFIGAGRDRRLPNNEESQYGPKAKALLAAAQAAAIAPATQAVPDMVRPVCRVMSMQHSSGAPDHYVSIEVGERQITPHMFKTKGRAEYEVAEWIWLLNGGEKPSILDFDTDPLPLATDPDADLKEKVAAARSRLAALSPEQQAAHWDAQRESFVRGQLMD